MTRWQKHKMTPHSYSARRKRSRTISLDEAMTRGYDPVLEERIVDAMMQLYGQNKMSADQLFDGKDRGLWMLPDGTLLSINPPKTDRNRQIVPYPIHHLQSFNDVRDKASLPTPDVLAYARIVRLWITSYGRLIASMDYLTEPQLKILKSLEKQAHDTQFEVSGTSSEGWKEFLRLAREKDSIIEAPA